MYVTISSFKIEVYSILNRITIEEQLHFGCLFGGARGYGFRLMHSALCKVKATLSSVSYHSRIQSVAKRLKTVQEEFQGGGKYWGKSIGRRRLKS